MSDKKRKISLELDILISCADPLNIIPLPHFFSNQVSLAVNWEYLLELAEKNKILPTAFRRLNQLPNNIKMKLNDLINSEEDRISSLNKSLIEACQLFNEHEINYVTIKSLRRYPFFYFADYDFLIAKKADQKTALKILIKLGYTFTKCTIFYDPYKFMCFRGTSWIDIYPKVAFDNIRVADAHLLVKRRIVRKYDNNRIYVCTLEDELLLDCSHTFVHGRITLAEAFEYIMFLTQEEIDWKYTFKHAEDNGIILYLYCFLKALNQIHYTIYEKTLISKNIFKIFSKYKIIKLIQHIWNENIKDKREIAPYKIPFVLIVFSALYRLWWNLKIGNIKELMNDLQGHFLMIADFLMDRLNIFFSLEIERSPNDIDKLF